ncbi:symmetrical bis(5'-nucleosyl)-tetraphosphatase [Thiohalomonas denitrificans]|uniref:symmetrical bis(5'-nucleosyl)-tetraphosphatase n=1 Tax=Thiohalomonas denitrificans TaxID=415747 RepID=UPI0026EB5673|nr:symmetrical bis(5'-nucleosyl)-tetraphosphatase [Thiohalomonas denitrificans]
MATYAIGDIQGCFDELQKLLERLAFDPGSDQLWFAGDLVNRGPRSLEVLRFVRDLGDRAVTVLGNHDLHLLAIWQHRDRLKRSDTLEPVLEAPDCDELLHWLRHRPLMHYQDPGYALVHAGLSPDWDLETALACARELETVLQGEQFAEFLTHMYGNQPDRWSNDLTGWGRLRYAVNCFTRLRYCATDGRLEFRKKDAPGSSPKPGFLPWFEMPGRRNADIEVIFGHWSTLGLYRDHGVRCLDTGCLWGGELTALRLEDDSITQLPCPRICHP